MSELIRLEQVSRVYSGATEVRALVEVDLSIRTGELLAITGSSGSGKSTLMNIVGCLDSPSSGRYLLRGDEVQAMDDDQLAKLRNRSIGFVFQSFNLLPRTTAAENVMLPLSYSDLGYRESRQRALEVLDLVGLSDRLEHTPAQLSGGQCQRVAIARALVNRPALILADEPTGNLDSKTSAEILDLMIELNASGATIILVTHEPEVAERAHRRITLADGRIIVDTDAGA